MRNAAAGDSKLLRDFEFNVNAKLSTILFGPYILRNRQGYRHAYRQCCGFSSKKILKAADGTTHFSIVPAASGSGGRG